MKRLMAFGADCCGPDLSWSCLLCSQVSCVDHDPSPGEIRLICDLCWNPIEHDPEERDIA